MEEDVLIGCVGRGEGIASRDYHLPTANLVFPHKPAINPGVYVALTTWKDRVYNSIVCFGEGERAKFEVHLFGFDKSIYGEQLEVSILEKISEFVPWESKERMRQKIAHDVEVAQRFFAKRKEE